MNRLAQTLMPLALSIGLAMGLESSAIASPRKSYQQYNRSGVVIVSPPRSRSYNYNHYEVDSHYDRRDTYHDDYYAPGSPPRRSRRYNSSDCRRRNRRVSRRGYSSGQQIIVNPPIYRDSYRNGGSIRVIRY